MREFPAITHLQFLILGALRQGPCSGRDLRALLEQWRTHRSGPAFYQMMARLEDAGLLDGRYEQQVVDGHAVKERHYEITAGGAAAWEATRDFYLGAIPAAEIREASRRA